MRVKDFVAFINARERHRIAKETGKPPRNPDPIISEYRFCNVRRNDDRVTKWIFGHYLARWRDNPDLWFALVVARLFNREETLEDIMPFVIPFWPDALRRTLHDRVASGLKVFNAAYIVSTNGIAKNKIDYLVENVLTPMWQSRVDIRRLVNVGQLANAHIALSDLNGLGSFMAAQVLADLKYAHPTRWEDFHTFAASGPGSRRGLNRVCGFKTGQPWRESHWRAMLGALRDRTNAKLKMEPLTAHDIQNCLCEFDKYERVRLGEGYPKQLYKPKGDGE